MAHKLPTDGGCWYCHEDTLPLKFTCEFDAYVHEKCLLDALTDAQRSKVQDREAEIMAQEFGIELEV